MNVSIEAADIMGETQCTDTPAEKADIKTCWFSSFHILVANGS
jgi:hypothetical protein